jgi:hypothetical protein
MTSMLSQVRVYFGQPSSRCRLHRIFGTHWLRDFCLQTGGLRVMQALPLVHGSTRFLARMIDVTTLLCYAEVC